VISILYDVVYSTQDGIRLFIAFLVVYHVHGIIRIR
jgi:hypothetical protein